MLRRIWLVKGGSSVTKWRCSVWLMGCRGAILLRRIWLAREGHHLVTEYLVFQRRFCRNKMALFCLIVGMERRHFVTENLACQGRFFRNKMALNRTAPFCYGKTPLARQIHRNKWRLSIPSLKQSSAMLLRKNLPWQAKFAVTKWSYFVRRILLGEETSSMMLLFCSLERVTRYC